MTVAVEAVDNYDDAGVVVYHSLLTAFVTTVRWFGLLAVGIVTDAAIAIAAVCRIVAEIVVHCEKGT